LKIVKLLILSLTSSVFLISETYQLNNGLSFGDINLVTPPKTEKKFPIRFINDVEISGKVPEKETSIYDEVTKNIKFELGLKFQNNLFLEAGSKLSFGTVSRDIEFYSESAISPYFRMSFPKLDIKKKWNLFFINSLEIDYISYSKQTPFFLDGSFPYNRNYDIGTEITSIPIFWKGSLIYKKYFFSVGPYLGFGINILNGNTKYLRFVQEDLNNTDIENIDYFDDGAILEAGESINLSTTFSPTFQSGFNFAIDFEPVHFSIGVDFSITSEANLYWSHRSYTMELSYFF